MYQLHYFPANANAALDFYLVMLARWARPMVRPPRSRPNIASF